MLNAGIDIAERGYGARDGRTLQICVGHRHMIGLPVNDFRWCELHDVCSTDDDEILSEPVMPIAFLQHSPGEWVIGGRDELLALREDIDKALELVI